MGEMKYKTKRIPFGELGYMEVDYQLSSKNNALIFYREKPKLKIYLGHCVVMPDIVKDEE